MNNNLDYANLDFILNKSITLYLTATPATPYRYSVVGVIDEVGLVCRALDQQEGTLIPFVSIARVTWEWTGAQVKAAS